MADLKCSVDEIVLLMQLLSDHFVKIQREQLEQGIEPSTPFEAQLMQKLGTARNEAMGRR